LIALPTLYVDTASTYQQWGPWQEYVARVVGVVHKSFCAHDFDRRDIVKSAPHHDAIILVLRTKQRQQQQR
jgi:hypothetical protein